MVVGPGVLCAGYDSDGAFKLRIEYADCSISSMSLDAFCGIRIQCSLEIYQIKALIGRRRQRISDGSPPELPSKFSETSPAKLHLICGQIQAPAGTH